MVKRLSQAGYVIRMNEDASSTNTQDEENTFSGCYRVPSLKMHEMKFYENKINKTKKENKLYKKLHWPIKLTDFKIKSHVETLKPNIEIQSS